MRFFIDEDIDVRVGAVLSDAGHDVAYARSVFGVQTKDPDNVAFARAEKRILVTGDRRLAGRLRQTRACACLNLLSLTDEVSRVRALVAVIELELSTEEIGWVQITTDMYHVGR